MGLPAIQLFMIAARQVSKPIAETVIRYGKNHPFFRNKILIPVGRSLVHLSTRIRMSKLGFGSPTQFAPVSEATALEQASDFIQQIVLFSYSVGVFAGYYYYTNYTTTPGLKVDEFEKWKEANATVEEELKARIARLEQVLLAAGYKLPVLPEPVKKAEVVEVTSVTPSDTKAKQDATVPSSSSAVCSPPPSCPSPPSPPPRSLLSRFPRISSLPLDSAQRVVFEGGSSSAS